MENKDKPAYPRNGYEHTNIGDHERFYHEDGLTKREMFAMAAMQGMLSNTNFDSKYFEEVARDSVRCADYILKQLES